MFFSRIHVDSSPSGNGHDGVKIITVTMDSVAMFYFRKHQSQETVRKELGYPNSISLFPGI